MARVELPSGAWVEYREKLSRKDRRVVLEARTVRVTEDGAVEVPGGAQERMRDALLGQIITGWSFADQGIPIPASNPFGDPSEVLDSALADLEDTNALEEAIAPLMAKVIPPNPARKPSPA